MLSTFVVLISESLEIIATAATHSNTAIRKSVRPLFYPLSAYHVSI